MAGRRRRGKGAAEGAGAFPSCPPQAGPSSSSGSGSRTAAAGRGRGGQGPGPRNAAPPAITATAAVPRREAARRPPGPAPPLPARYHCAGPGSAPSALLSSPPPSRLYPRTIDPAFLPHIRGLYAEPAEASRLPPPGADRASPAALVTCLRAGLATLPAGLGGPPPRHGRPQPVPPAPPGARTHGHTTHTHSWQRAEGGRRGGDERAGPALHTGCGGRAPALPPGGGGQGASGAAANSRQSRAGGGRTAGEGRRRPPVRMRRPVPGWGEVGTSGCGGGRGPQGALVGQAREWERAERGLARWVGLPVAPTWPRTCVPCCI